MDNRLYELMNWPRIEALVYSEEDEPQEILGPHKTEEGILVQAFLPTAVKMTAVIRGTGKEYEMERREIERAEELYEQSGIFDLLGTDPGEGTDTGERGRTDEAGIWNDSQDGGEDGSRDRVQDDGQNEGMIEVEEIEIGK